VECPQPAAYGCHAENRDQELEDAGGDHRRHPRRAGRLDPTPAAPPTLVNAVSWFDAVSGTFPAPEVIGVGAAVLVVAVVVTLLIGRRSGRRALSQRLTALGTRLGIDTPDESAGLESALSYLEQVTGAATEAVADSSSDAIRLRRSLDTFPQGVVLCDENGTVVYRNARASALMTSRHGDALAAQAVTELLEDAWDAGAAERTLDLYGPPRRTLTVRARLIDDGRRALGVVAIIEDVSERRRLEEIRRDFVANVSHELKTPMGALGLLAETLVAEPDVEVARRLASRIHSEAFRVSRIIDDLLDLSRIESETAPPREPVLVNLVMAEAVERVRASADQRGITIALNEPDPPVVVLGDRRQLVSAMHALIENAVTYSYEGSTIDVAAKVAPATLEAPAGSWAAGGVTRFTTPAPAVAQVASTVIVAPGVATTAPPAPWVPSAAPAAPGAVPAVPGVPGEAVPAPVESAPVEPAPVEPAGTGDVPGDGRDGVRPPTAPELTPPAGSRSTEPATTAWTPQPPGLPGNPAPPATSAPTEPGSPAHSTSPAADAEATGASSNGETAPARPSKDAIRISVTDHGVGIPARDLDRIFERFYRVDHGRSRDTGGTGLGLSIVRHVANNHQGWVEVESREGEGSTFTLVLPLQPDRNA
jgi:signal transduction histidine kinase